MSKDAFIAAHEALVEEYLDANPDVSWEEAYDITADYAWDRVREAMADLYVRLSGKTIHASDCATSCAPAEMPGPCDCTVEQGA